MFTERTGITRDGVRAPHVLTPNGSGMVSVGAGLDTVLDASEEAAAFAASLDLNDNTCAAFVLSLARWCDWGNRRDPHSYAIVTLADYCQARGWQKHHKGGYKQEHKDLARKEMFNLNKVWVRHKVPAHMSRTGKLMYVEGQLMVVAVESIDAASRQPTAFRVSPGAWASDYLKDNPNATSLVLDSVLTIGARGSAHGRSPQLAQRLGIYMALQWRTKIINNNGGQSHRVAGLLEAVGIDPNTVTHHEERKRQRTYLEGALDLLQDANAIGTRDESGAIVEGWEYANPEAGNPDAPADWESWLRWKVSIPAPREVTAFYDGVIGARGVAITAQIGKNRRRERATNAAKAKQANKEGGNEQGS